MDPKRKTQFTGRNDKPNKKVYKSPKRQTVNLFRDADLFAPDREDEIDILAEKDVYDHLEQTIYAEA